MGLCLHQFPLRCQFDRYQNSKVNVRVIPTPHVEIHLRNVPKTLLHKSWFLSLIRIEKGFREAGQGIGKNICLEMAVVKLRVTSTRFADGWQFLLTIG